MKKIFSDWAGQSIYYKLSQELLDEDSTDLGYRCYTRETPDQEWYPMGRGVTKEKALKDAIYWWNWSDTVGRG